MNALTIPRFHCGSWFAARQAAQASRRATGVLQAQLGAVVFARDAGGTPSLQQCICVHSFRPGGAALRPAAAPCSSTAGAGTARGSVWRSCAPPAGQGGKGGRLLDLRPGPGSSLLRRRRPRLHLPPDRGHQARLAGHHRLVPQSEHVGVDPTVVLSTAIWKNRLNAGEFRWSAWHKRLFTESPFCKESRG